MTKNKVSSSAAFGAKKQRIDENEEEDEDYDDDNGSEEDEDGTDDDDDQEGSIAVALVDYAHNLLNAPATITSLNLQTKVEKALKQAMVMAMAEDGTQSLQKMLDKGRGRDLTDGKVPPGSGAVRRTFSDARFLLCSACVALAKVCDLRGDLAGAISSLQDACIFFPRSAEANEFLARLLKTEADSEEKLGKVEFFFRRSASAGEDVAATIAALRPFAPTQSSNAISSSGNSDSSALSYAEFSSAPDLGRDLRLLEKEQVASGQALQALSLLLCQAGRVVEATPLLVGQGFRWRLAREVLCYAPSDGRGHGDDGPQPDPLSALPVRVVDGALPPAMLRHLQEVFRPTSPFWAEHFYDAVSNASRAVGYFSYLFPLTPTPTLQARCSVEQVILFLYRTYVRRLFPAAADTATVAEWWVHSRPHSSGHQLHFDSDETGLEGGGKAEHPICSLIVYLGGDGDGDGDGDDGPAVGGPTLVTDQRLAGPLATRGWLCHPKCNRLAAFDAQFLHGVVPGRGPNPRVGARRLTFMVGFWRAIKAQPRGLDVAGPGQPFPAGTETSYTWHKEMALRPELDSATGPDAPVSIELVAPQPVATVWEPVEASASAGKAVGGVDYNTCFQGF